MFITSERVVLGALAYWSVYQSPHIYPDDLTEGLLQFYVRFKFPRGLFETNYEELRQKVRDTLDRCPVIAAWGSLIENDYLYTLSGGIPSPWGDINLDALAKNIARSVEQQLGKI